jgi:hypothetical protein
MRIHQRIAAMALAVAVASAAGLSAQEKKAAAPAPDEKVAMEAMMNAATPGEPHKKLEQFVGTWDAKVSMWMKPGAPPEQSTGTSEATSVLGGRYVAEKFEGTFMGQPFSGMGMTGYDNVTKKYVGTWADTAGTGIMMSTGTMNKAGNSIAMKSSMPDPVTGKMTAMQGTMTIADTDHHTYEMWGPGPDGKNYKMMEITYTRKK